MPDVLALRDIHFSRDSRPILTNINWVVAPNQLAAILGPNGCGKSTLLRIASGYLWPQRGAVQLLGETLGETELAKLRARVGIVEANTIYPFDESMSAHDVVSSGYFSALTLGYVHPTPDQFHHAAQLLHQVGLANHLDQPYHTMSTGERMRCLIARAMVRKPELLILDEPTAGLDLPARETILATLTRLHTHGGPAIIMVTHHLEELLPSTQNLLLLSRQGAIVAQGAPQHVLTDANMSTAYGVNIHVSHRHNRFSAHVDPATWDQLL